MKPSQALPVHRKAIRRIVAAHRTSNPRIYGSVLSGTDVEGSDLDVLADDTPETSLLDLARIARQLSELLGVPVDVRTPLDLPTAFRERVMTEAQPV